MLLVSLEGDLSDPFVREAIFQLPLFLLSIYITWYIFQSRELKRFSSDKAMAKREQQMRGIFDSQSDAIIIVEKSQEDRESINELVP